MGAAYRVRQFVKAVSASVTDDELRTVSQRLGPCLHRLFVCMDPRDQRHCLDTFAALQEEGSAGQNLLDAALLHDCGKALGSIAIWHRVALVLTNAAGLRGLEAAAGAPRGSLRHTLYVQREHARLGADLAAGCGASPELVSLIRWHESGAAPAGDAVDAATAVDLEALRRADCAN